MIQEDLRLIRPTIMCSVPRIYEKIYAKIQDRVAQKGGVTKWLTNLAASVGYRVYARQNGIDVPFTLASFLDPLLHPILDHLVGKSIRRIFGGRPHVMAAGGAAFNPVVSHFFLAMGINIMQGYGLTETCPVISINVPGINRPETCGPYLDNLEVRLGENDELQVRGPSVMQGYFHREEDTRAVFTDDGWFKTGDQADLIDGKFVKIKGRIKEIIVTSTGEKIPPADLELAIEADGLFSQAMVVGDDRPYVAVLCVVNQTQLETVAKSLHLETNDPEKLLMDKKLRNFALRRVKAACAKFPNYGIPRNIRLLADPWTIDNGLLTPTLKLKRNQIRARYCAEIEELYGDIRSQR